MKDLTGKEIKEEKPVELKVELQPVGGVEKIVQDYKKKG
jgi:hypothetical protein